MKINYSTCLLFITFPFWCASQSIIAEYRSLSSSANFEEQANFVLVSNLNESVFYNEKIEEGVYESEEKDLYGLPQTFEVRFEKKENYIHKSFRSKKLTEFVTDFNGNYLQIDDSLGVVKWELTNEKREILGTRCSMATTKFRGRKYEVWYNEEVPIANGPWKFGGLPGLIYSMQEESGLIGYEIRSLEFREGETINVSYPKIKPQKSISPQEYLKIYLEQLEDFYAFKEAQLRKEGSNITISIDKNAFEPVEIFDSNN